jgi:putative transposase
MRRLKVSGRDKVYHVMTRTVNGELLFKDREKEIIRKMIHQVSDFCGLDVLTYCIMSDHFDVLLRVPDEGALSDAELMRRYKVLYSKPTKYQQASADIMVDQLKAGGEEAEAIRRKLLARMSDVSDVSEFMKAVKDHQHCNSYHVIFFGSLGAQVAFLFNLLKHRNARITKCPLFLSHLG